MRQVRRTSKAQTGRVARLRKPEEMSLEAWQVALRRQFAVEQRFKVRNIGGRPVFSEYEVANPQTGRAYRVAVRGEGLGVNYCSCPDFATNTLGTCKHIEFLLGRLRRQRGGKAALAGGYRPPFSEVYLRHGAQRAVVFHAGTHCPESLRSFAAEFFDAGGVLRPEAVRRFHTFLEQAGGEHDGHEVRCYDDALAMVSQMRDREELVKRIEGAFPGGPDGPACRLFLSTDAGGVGLNLQHASVVANMDLPWNPAVLEQRIGRVHRLGQRRPVRVVHFIAKGTIEEGMLGLLSFKKSVFSGVLDGGEKEVFLGGTRLKQFMDTVDKAASAIPSPMPSDDADGGNGQARKVPPHPRGLEPTNLPPPSSATHAAGTQAQPLHGPGSPIITPQTMGDLLTAGAALLNQLGQSLRQAAQDASQGGASSVLGSLVARDDATGQTYLRLPLPKQDVLGPLLDLLRAHVGPAR